MWDSPNSARADRRDALRQAGVGAGMGGALYAPSSYFMKRPPEQYTDDVARAKIGTCIAGSDHHGQPGFELVLSQATGI